MCLGERVDNTKLDPVCHVYGCVWKRASKCKCSKCPTLKTDLYIDTYPGLCNVVNSNAEKDGGKQSRFGARRDVNDGKFFREKENVEPEVEGTLRQRTVFEPGDQRKRGPLTRILSDSFLCRAFLLSPKGVEVRAHGRSCMHVHVSAVSIYLCIAMLLLG